MVRIVSLLLVLATTGFSPFAVGQDSGVSDAPSATDPSVSSQSISRQSLVELEKEIKQYVGKDYAVGAELLVIENGKTLFHDSFGFSDRESERLWENDTLCNIRSMTKPITSAAAQLLIDRNQLELDAPVATYLPSFDNEKSKSITVRQVLTHRSGLPLTNLVSVNQYSSLAKQVAAAGKIGPYFEPGSKFWYSDLGTDVVAAIVEKVSGEPMEEFVGREIFEPLGMSNTLYGIDGTDKRLLAAASLYIGGSNEWTRFWKPEKPLYPFAWGSQTVYSTTTDYAKFLQMMMNEGRVGDRQLLSKNAVQRMLKPVSRTSMMGSDIPAPTEFRNLEVYYGQMMVTHHPIGKDKDKPVIIGHSGSDGTNAWAWPARDLIVLYFTQSRGGLTVLKIEEPIDRLIIHADEIAEPVPAAFQPYVGTFIANYSGFHNEEFTVKVINGKLVLDVPSQLAFKLLEPNEKKQWAFALAPKQIYVTFDKNDESSVVGLRLHKTGEVYEVPRKGTARALELTEEKRSLLAAKAAGDRDSEEAVSENPKQGSETSKWKGTLNAPGIELRLEIDIVENEGKYSGELTSIDQNNAKLKVTRIKIEDEELSFSIAQNGATFRGKLSKNGTVAEGTFSQSGNELPLTLTKATPDDEPDSQPKETLKEAWVGKLKIGGMEPVMQFRIVTKESGETAAYFDSVTEGKTGFKATWSIKDDSISFDVARINLKYRGTLNETRDTAEGTWTQGGRELPLTLEKKSAIVDNKNVWQNRPQRPVAPFPYDAEEVTFENKADGITLAGTLTIPKKPGKHPVVVLISGSGPQDRDETWMEHKPFLVLADYLSRQGIAVLRYDDRGTAKSTGEFAPATTEDFARDASAAVEFLSDHERINSSEIGLGGHSEGGLIAPMVVGLRDDIAFVALLAATGVDGKTISLSQTEAILRAADRDEGDIQISLFLNEAILTAAAEAQPGEGFSDALKLASKAAIQQIPEDKREEVSKLLAGQIENQKERLGSNWMQFFLSYDPRPALKAIDCPVLAIIGTKDLQVLPDLNMPEIKKALTEGGNDDFEMVELEGLNHLFQKCETGSMSEYVTIQETFNPEALKKIGDWIIVHTHPVK